MSYNGRLGWHCHWCGEPVPLKSGLRTGNHVYCDNGGKCKMAHARAFAKYKARVTPKAAAARDLVAAGGPGGNAKAKSPAARMAAEISADRSSSGNRGMRRG